MIFKKVFLPFLRRNSVLVLSRVAVVSVTFWLSIRIAPDSISSRASRLDLITEVRASISTTGEPFGKLIVSVGALSPEAAPLNRAWAVAWASAAACSPWIFFVTSSAINFFAETMSLLHIFWISVTGIIVKKRRRRSTSASSTFTKC